MTGFFLRAVLLGVLAGDGLAETPPAPPEVLPLPEEVTAWDRAVARFEGEVQDLSSRLDTLNGELRRLKVETARLQGEVRNLRSSSESGPHPLREARLKDLLAALQPKVERVAELEAEREHLRRRWEEKAVSLLKLYDDRIDEVLGSAGPFLDPTLAEALLEPVVRLVRKRGRLQESLSRRQKGPRLEEEPDSMPVLPQGGKSDALGLRLTLGLLKDRKGELEARLERSYLEEEEILKEIRLQERMREFLRDVERMGEDATFPPPGAGDAELRMFLGRQEARRLEERLREVRARREEDKLRLFQIEHYLETVRFQLEKKEGGMKR